MTKSPIYLADLHRGSARPGFDRDYRRLVKPQHGGIATVFWGLLGILFLFITIPMLLGGSDAPAKKAATVKPAPHVTKTTKATTAAKVPVKALAHKPAVKKRAKVKAKQVSVASATHASPAAGSRPASTNGSGASSTRHPARPAPSKPKPSASTGSGGQGASGGGSGASTAPATSPSTPAPATTQPSDPGVDGCDPTNESC